MALFGPKTTPAPMTNFSSPNNQFGGLQQLGGMQQQSLGGMQQQSLGGMQQPQLQQQQFGGSMQQQQQQGMFGQIQQQPSMFPQQPHHQSQGGAFAGLGQLGGQAFNQPPMQPSNPQNSKNSDPQNTLDKRCFLSLDMFDMFANKPGPQINNNQAPTNNPFLDSNQVEYLNQMSV